MVIYMSYEKKFNVTEDMIAEGIGLNVKVLSTPSLILAMEITCHESVSDALEDGQTTVGTGVCIKHMKPTKLGEEFTVKVVNYERNGRKLKFNVEAYDRDGKIGAGEHYRYIVDKRDFEAKLQG